MEKIIIKGARQHNLKNLDVEIPKNQLVVFTGLSGSGKSSLAFETIYAEGQRRYVESLSAYARQFLGMMEKPEVDKIEGLSPAIAIDQKGISHNPRSTVGTVTEIYDYLRLLFARIGHPHCPNCGREIAGLSVDQIVDSVLRTFFPSGEKKKPVKLMILSPIVKDRKGEFVELLKKLRKQGYYAARIDGRIYHLDEDLTLIKTNRHTIEVVIDRLILQNDERARLSESIEKALDLADGEVSVSQVLDKDFEFPEKPRAFEDHLFSKKYACPVCQVSLAEIEPRSFSFNSPHGACKICLGIGTQLKVDPQLVVNPHLSFSEGGFIPLGSQVEHDTWYVRTIKAMAQEEGIALDVPLGRLKKQELQKLLFGTGQKIYEVWGSNRHGRLAKINETFEGLIPRLERLYLETESEWRRKEVERYMRKELCPACQGARLKKEALSVTVAGKSIVEINRLSIALISNWVETLSEPFSQDLNDRERAIAAPILKELKKRLKFLNDVGLDYLTLDRESSTLAGGEAQRINLASQIGSGLTGVLYVLDEPTVGLHERDNEQLIRTLKQLRDLGNSLIVVEHDRRVMENADFILDFGPGGGKHGGKIVAQGKLEAIKQSKTSLTGKYLKEELRLEIKKWENDEGKFSEQRVPSEKHPNGVLSLIGARGHNLKNIDVDFPLGKFICVTGVSGSGKSTLVQETLYHSLASLLNERHRVKPADHDGLRGYELVSRVLLIDQSPIGRTPRSNPATYTKTFDYIRQIFALTREAKIKGFRRGRFSFNVSGGRCEACRGQGQNRVEMQFLPSVWINCEVCQGKRYNSETLSVEYKGKNIAEVLKMTIEEALEFFPLGIEALQSRLQTLNDVGLGYLELGQPAPTLSGGEAQRIKIATELAKTSKGQTVYLLDEPTTGLHFEDLKRLLRVLRRLQAAGNTVIVIEHNLDVIKNADWIIDLGPEGGEEGGYLVGQGRPEELIRNKHSFTGRFLRQVI